MRLNGTHDMGSRARTRPPAMLALLCIAIGLLSTTGCYNRAYRLPSATYPTPDSLAWVTFVEADDRGNFWNAAQAQGALDAVRTSARAGPTVVVLFIHGWGHNASNGDQNLVCFANTLDYLGRRLNVSAIAQEARAQVARAPGGPAVKQGRTEEKPIRVQGIYVGWRGKSLGELPGALSFITRFTTFWGRKGAANQVGRGDLRSFVNALAFIYDSVHTPGPRGVEDQSLFGLVSVGHSFGAQVLLPAVLERLQAQLHSQATDSAWRALRGLPVNWTRSSYVDGVGDLVVLVNPAVEASIYEPLYRLGRSLRFSREQTPALAVFSADNDLARRWLFPIGRFFSTATMQPTSNAHAGDEAWWSRERVAVGLHDPQVTHRLFWEPGASAYESPKTREQKPSARSDNPFSQSHADCRITDSNDPGGLDELATALQKDSTADVTAEWRINGKHLLPLGQHRPNEALMVVRTRSKEIIDNHNGFFTPEFIDFLVRYVTDIETKRVKTKAPSRHLEEERARKR